MQEIKKRRIVLASVLKPVNDIRMFEKMALTLSQSYVVDVIGFPVITDVLHEVNLHPLPSFRRLSFGRIMAPVRVLQKILRLRPDIFIITTHELLIISAIAKLLTGCKIVYDVQENYARNVLHTNTFASLFRPAIAGWIRLKEWASRPLISHYLLAESAYQREMSFPPDRFTVIENKFKRAETSDPVIKDDDAIRLIFTGTLAESTGVFIAIDLATALNQIDQSIRLTIIGYCAQETTYQRLRTLVESKPFVTLVGGDKLVPHTDILKSIAQADFGIIAYPPNASTENAVPTKLYEYLGNTLPILMINHAPWVEICAPYTAAVAFDAQQIKADSILASMRETTFYTVRPAGIFWEDEAKKLLSAVSSLH